LCHFDCHVLAQHNASDSDYDSDYDDLLDELENDPELLRLKELQLEQMAAAVQHAAKLAAQGYGLHTEVHSSEVSAVLKVRSTNSFDCTVDDCRAHI
jgi:hypothetical protein